MDEKLQKWLPKPREIINVLKEQIDIIHSALGKSDSVLFRGDLTMLIWKWADKLSDKEADIDTHDTLPF